MQGGGQYKEGYVTGVTSGFAIIELPFRPKSVIAVYDKTTIAPTNRFSFYTFDGTNERGYYCNSTGTVSWNQSNSYWDAATHTIHMRVVQSATNQRNVAYVAVG